MRRYVLVLSLVAFALSGCGPVADMLAGEGDAPEETTQEETASAEEPLEPVDGDEAGPDPEDGDEAEPDAEDGDEADPDPESTADDAWDEVVQTNFSDACLSTSRGATGYCRCALDRLQERFSQADFEAMEQEMVGSDALPPEFEEVIDACVEEHQDELAVPDEPADGEWSARAQSEFLFGCIESSGGMTDHCECVLDGMQETYTEGEFEELSLALEQGEATPQEFDAVVDACLEQRG